MALLETTSQLTFQDTIQYPAISIQQGSFTFITGKSGCGKSTYLRYLNGILPSEENQIFYREQPLSHYPILSYRKQVLLVPQSVYLLDASIRENFHFYYDSREQARLSDEEIQHFLSVCCLAATPEQLCSTLSGGEPMQQPEACYILAEGAKKLNLNVWVYTGYTWEELLKKNNPSIQKLLQKTDILIDGRFIASLRSLELAFKGSSNQRTIDVQKSLLQNHIILYKKNVN